MRRVLLALDLGRFMLVLAENWRQCSVVYLRENVPFFSVRESSSMHVCDMKSNPGRWISFSRKADCSRDSLETKNRSFVLFRLLCTTSCALENQRFHYLAITDLLVADWPAVWKELKMILWRCNRWWVSDDQIDWTWTPPDTDRPAMCYAKVILE